MGDVAVPKVYGKSGFVATYAVDKVFLEGSVGFLRMVSAVAMRRDQLKHFVGFGHEFLEPGRALGQARRESHRNLQGTPYRQHL